jgi:hypothetical protein
MVICDCRAQDLPTAFIQAFTYRQLKAIKLLRLLGNTEGYTIRNNSRIMRVAMLTHELTQVF